VGYSGSKLTCLFSRFISMGSRGLYHFFFQTLSYSVVSFAALFQQCVVFTHSSVFFKSSKLMLALSLLLLLISVYICL
jgi:cytochrome bd-type quinol oxidase subunit 1